MKRGKLTKREYDALMARQGYACASWGCANPGPYQADHKQALCLGGDNGASNWQLLCRDCHKAKSAEEVARKSKADRQGGGRGSQWLRRKEGKTKSIPKRPFQGWRGFAGNIIRRER